MEISKTHYMTKGGVKKRKPVIRLTRDEKESIYAYVKSMEFDDEYIKIA